MTGQASENVAAVWAAFCDQIKAAGAEILESAQGLDTVSQAEGLRYLTRLLRGSFEKYIEFSDPLDPVIYKMSDERNKYGGDNPDNIYSASSLSDQEEYEIAGHRGSVGHFNFSIFKWGTDGVWQLTSIKEGREIECDAQGDFRLALGGERKDGNWMPIAPGANLILLRQTFADRSAEVEVTVKIRLVSKSPSIAQITLEQAQTKLKAAEQFFCNTGRMMHEWSKALVPTVNRLSATDPELIKKGGWRSQCVLFLVFLEDRSGPGAAHPDSGISAGQDVEPGAVQLLAGVARLHQLPHSPEHEHRPQER
jgi:hypothetical protein